MCGSLHCEPGIVLYRSLTNKSAKDVALSNKEAILNASEKENQSRENVTSGSVDTSISVTNRYRFDFFHRYITKSMENVGGEACSICTNLSGPTNS